MTEIAMHGHGVRGMRPDTLTRFSDNGDPGKFGRMFRNLVPLFVPDDALAELAEAMKDKPAQGGNPDPAGDNPKIPAGYTYLGQFIDHDITLDTTPLDQQRADPNATKNFRTPALDLDSVYGDGPGIHPYLYARDRTTFAVAEKLLVGHTVKSFADRDRKEEIPSSDNDLPRNQVGHALIFDERNDENLLVAQLHLLMLKFHNKVVDWLGTKQPGLKGPALFKEARRIVTWHYQWIVLFDFVERLTEPGLVTKIKQKGRQFYRFQERPYMPAEFAAAAYRLGHSMVRETYSHNRVFNPEDGSIGNGTLDLLFFFTGKSGKIVGELAPCRRSRRSPLRPACPRTGRSTGGGSSTSRVRAGRPSRSITRVGWIRSSPRRCTSCPGSARTRPKGRSGRRSCPSATCVAACRSGCPQDRTCAAPWGSRP